MSEHESQETVDVGGPEHVPQSQSTDGQMNDRAFHWTRSSVVGVALIVIVVLTGVSFLIYRMYGGDPKLEQKTMPVSFIEVEPVDFVDQNRVFTGVIKAAKSSDLSFELGGYLANVEVSEGDVVKQGDVIATLDTERLKVRRKQLKARRKSAKAVYDELKNGPRKQTIAAAKAERDAIQEQKDQAEKDFKRRQRLENSGAISKEELQRSSSNLQMLAKNLEASEKRLAELNDGTRVEKVAAQLAVLEEIDANLESVEVDLRKSEIKAPFDGKISTQFLDPGSIINPGVPVIRIVQSQNLEAWIGIPSHLISSIQNLKSPEIIAGQNASTIPVKLKNILPEIEATTRTRQVVFTVSPAAKSSTDPETNTASHSDSECEASEASLMHDLAPGQIIRIRCQVRTKVSALLTKNKQGVHGQCFVVPTECLIPSARGVWSILTVDEISTDQNDSKSNSRETKMVVGRRDVTVISTNQDTSLVQGTLDKGDRIINTGVHKLVIGQKVEPTKSKSSLGK